MGKVMSATGHRPDKLGGYRLQNNPVVSQIKSEITNKLKVCVIQYGFDTFWSGAAQGFDQIFFEVVEDLRVEFPYIKNNLAIPDRTFGSNWPQVAQKSLKDLCKLADEVVYVCDGGYNAYNNQKRNEFLVNKADGIMACWDGSRGGTFNCIQYAKFKRKPILRLNPRNWTWSQTNYEVYGGVQ